MTLSEILALYEQADKLMQQGAILESDKLALRALIEISEHFKEYGHTFSKKEFIHWHALNRRIRLLYSCIGFSQGYSTALRTIKEEDTSIPLVKKEAPEIAPEFTSTELNKHCKSIYYALKNQYALYEKTYYTYFKSKIKARIPRKEGFNSLFNSIFPNIPLDSEQTNEALDTGTYFNLAGFKHLEHLMNKANEQKAESFSYNDTDNWTNNIFLLSIILSHYNSWPTEYKDIIDKVVVVAKAKEGELIAAGILSINKSHNVKARENIKRKRAVKLEEVHEGEKLSDVSSAVKIEENSDLTHEKHKLAKIDLTAIKLTPPLSIKPVFISPTSSPFRFFSSPPADSGFKSPFNIHVPMDSVMSLVQEDDTGEPLTKKEKEEREESFTSSFLFSPSPATGNG